jgi:clan AA aspartic protease (TIGR02281 family)
LQAKGYIGAAVRDYDTAISLDPENAIGYYNRGVARESVGDVGRARADYQVALSKTAKSPDGFKARGLARHRLAALPQEQQIAAPIVSKPSSRTEVSLKAVGGIFVVPVEMNGAITLDFTIDSGASDVTVPADVFSTLARTGTIRDADISGEQTYVLADGSKTHSATFTIRSLKVGDKVIENVRGSVAPAQGNLLLGQSFLQRFKSWSIDNSRHELLLELK